MQIPYTSKVANKREGLLLNITQALQGNISLGNGTNTNTAQNIQGQWVSVTIAAANTPQVVKLPLPTSSIPVGFLVVLKSAACDIFAASSDVAQWSTSQIQIQGTVAGVTVILFVL